MSPSSRASRWALRPRRPGLTFLPLLADRRSPPKRTLPPPVDDELVRQECDGTRRAQERGAEKSRSGLGHVGTVRSGQDDEVVAVDDLVGQPVGELGGAAAGDRAQDRRGGTGPGPWRTTAPSSSTISTASSASNVALDARARPPASSDVLPSHERAARAVVDDDPAGRARRERDPQLAARQPLARAARTTVPTGAPGDARRRPRRARRPAAITARTPDHAAILAAASLLAMPPLPRSVPAPPATASSAASTSTISSISDASASRRGIGGEQPGGVGEHHAARRRATRCDTSAARRSLSP